MFGGVFCGRLLDAGHLRVQLCAGITLQFIGTALASFATRYWQILISQGLCVGMGSSFLWLPSVVVIAQYFDTKIMIATGIAATGSSAGKCFLRYLASPEHLMLLRLEKG
jgi:MFS family permease